MYNQFKNSAAFIAEKATSAAKAFVIVGSLAGTAGVATLVTTQVAEAQVPPSPDTPDRPRGCSGADCDKKGRKNINKNINKNSAEARARAEARASSRSTSRATGGTATGGSASATGGTGGSVGNVTNGGNNLMIKNGVAASSAIVTNGSPTSSTRCKDEWGVGVTGQAIVAGGGVTYGDAKVNLKCEFIGVLQVGAGNEGRNNAAEDSVCATREALGLSLPRHCGGGGRPAPRH